MRRIVESNRSKSLKKIAHRDVWTKNGPLNPLVSASSNALVPNVFLALLVSSIDDFETLTIFESTHTMAP